jgi:hypothetical protein
MRPFNDTSTGIFADGNRCADGIPVGDTFAAGLRAKLFGAGARDWGKDKLGRFISAFTSDQLARMDDEGAAGWRRGQTPPKRPGVYLLKDGSFALYTSRGWHARCETAELAAGQSELAGTPSPIYRVKEGQRWLGPCAIEVSAFD